METIIKEFYGSIENIPAGWHDTGFVVKSQSSIPSGYGILIAVDGIKKATVIRLVKSDGSVLLLKRHPQDRNKNGWCLAGGKMEAGETPLKGVLREFKEECGYLLSAAKVKPIGAYESDINGVTALVFVFEYRIQQKPNNGYSGYDDILISDEHCGFQWAHPSEFDEIKFAGKTRIALQMREGEYIAKGGFTVEP